MDGLFIRENPIRIDENPILGNIHNFFSGGVQSYLLECLGFFTVGGGKKRNESPRARTNGKVCLFPQNPAIFEGPGFLE